MQIRLGGQTFEMVVLADTDGNPYNAGGGGGGGGGDASAANQLVMIDFDNFVAELLGNKSDSPYNPGDSDITIMGGLKLLAYGATVAVDSTGNPLPVQFNSLAQAMTYNGTKLQTLAKTDGTNTWTQTYGYTGDNLTSISAWVKS